ncbi:3047_t:CDS:2 [Dentiscutata erythropus]|uniref:3047_t:CDS:1 n=1 Tax=Dentiscutata erythropus TaxID=1348616 RepID=A0A9N9DV31_9GLOM|nr:3047_t:CDS:2 [Dentiscutata erythropus]
MNSKNVAPKANDPWDDFFAPMWESTTSKQRTRPSNGKDVRAENVKSQGDANLKKKIGGNETDKKTKLQRKFEKTSANVTKDTSHKNNNDGFIKKSKKISEPTKIVNKSINKGKDNGTINRSNDILHNDVSKADSRRKTTPDLSLKYPKAVPCSLEEIFGEPIFPNSKKPDSDIRMPSGSKREECAKKPDLAIKMASGSKREECAKKPDHAIRMPSGSKREECAKKPDPAIRMPSGSKREECAKKPDPAIRMPSGSKREECASVSTRHKPKDLTHLKTLEDYQREAEAMGHKLPSDRDPPNTTYYPRIKRLLDPASLKLPITNPDHPKNVIKYLATVPPRTNPVQLNKLKRVQSSNFGTNKSTSQIGTKSQINRPVTEKKIIGSSKVNSDTRRTFSKSISELHKTPIARSEKRTPRELSIIRESPQVRDKIHVTHKESTNRKRIAHEESHVRDPSNIKRRLTNNPTQQMSNKRSMHFSPEPSRPVKRQQIRHNREDSIDEMNVSSIIQSIFRPSAVEVFSEEARSSKIGRKEDEEQERLDQQRRLLKTRRLK